MELKHILTEKSDIVFRFEEDGDEFAILLPDRHFGFGYLAFEPLAITHGAPEQVDEALQAGDVILTYIGQERTLVATAQVIASLLEQRQIPLRMTIEERHQQRMLTFITNTLFFDEASLGADVIDILWHVHEQIPEIASVTEPEQPAVPADPLDRIGLDDTVSIYMEGDEEDGDEPDLVPASEVTDT